MCVPADEGIVASSGLPMTLTGSAVPPGQAPGNAPRSGLLARLLHADIKKRIGCLKNGAEDIKKHKWFRGLNWAALYNKQMAAPTFPSLAGDDDHSSFPKYFDSVEESGPLLEAAKQALYDYW